MTDAETKDGGRSATTFFVLLLVGLPLMVFAPLILSFIEYSTIGTDHVEGFCRDIGIHELLTTIYRPVIRFLEALF